MVTTDIASDTEITGTSICRATRSAVRCRVPVSEVGMFGSGTRWTLPRATREQSEARIRAPSILASSDRRWGVNSASRRNPPEHTERTSGPSPTTMRAPLLAWRMRSMPSRSGVPGATIRNASSSASERRTGTSGSSEASPASLPRLGERVEASAAGAHPGSEAEPGSPAAAGPQHHQGGHGGGDGGAEEQGPGPVGGGGRQVDVHPLPRAQIPVSRLRAGQVGDDLEAEAGRGPGGEEVLHPLRVDLRVLEPIGQFGNV